MSMVLGALMWGSALRFIRVKVWCKISWTWGVLRTCGVVRKLLFYNNYYLVNNEISDDLLE